MNCPWKPFTGEFSYAASYWPTFRTFRLLRSLPIVAEFFALRYTLELTTIEHTNGSTYITARLPWHDSHSARRLCYVRSIRELYITGYDLDCGTLEEVFFLRLVRQGDAEELAGPHCRVRDRPPR